MKHLGLILALFTCISVKSQQSPSISNEELIPFQKNGKWGLVDSRGKVKLHPQFDSIGSFIEGIAIVKKENHYYYFNDRLVFGSEVPESYFKKRSAFESKDKDFLTIQVGGKATATLSTSSTGICPPNLDFEYGNFSNWGTYAGSVDVALSTMQNQITVSPSSPINDRHTIYSTSSNQVDFFGGFPITPPNSSQYALKLGNYLVGAQAERVRYVINVPPDPNYSITFQYAVVLENPEQASTGVAHSYEEQPRLTAKLFNPVTQEYLPCASFTYVASQVGTIPGFALSPIAGGPVSSPQGSAIWYKPWSSVYVNLGNYQNQQLYLEFTTADCTKGGHFGYAYVDVKECGIGIQSQVSCSTPSIATLSAPEGFATYKWYDANFATLLGSGQTLTLNPSPPLGTNFHVVVNPYNNTNCSGCICSDTLHASLAMSYPSPNAGPDKIICFGNTTPIGSSPHLGLAYSWSPTNGLSSATSANPIVQVNSNSQYVLTVTDLATNCIAKDTMDIYVKPKPSSGFTINKVNQCLSGNNFIFTNTSNISTGQLTYLWDFGDGNSSAMQHPVHSYLLPGSYTIKLLVTSEFGCLDSISKQVMVQSIPDVSFNYNASMLCLKSNLFNFLLLNPSSGVNYSWSLGDGFGLASGNIVNYTYLQPGTYIVKVVAINSNGCRDSLMKPVVVHPMPVAGFTVNQPAQCVNGNQFQFSNTSTSIDGYTSSWAFGDLSTSQTNSPVHQYVQSGSYSVQIVVTSPFQCKDTSTGQVIVHPKPNLVVSTTSLPGQCLTGNNFSFTNGSTVSIGTLSYLWQFGDGISSALATPSHTYLQPGSYNVKLVATSSSSCKDSTIIPVTIYAMPSVSVVHSLPLVFCAGDSVVLTAQATPGSGTINSFQWYKDNLLLPGETLSVLTVYAPGVYKVVVGNSFGCFSNAEKVVVVNPLPSGDLQLPAQNFICQGSSVVLTASGGISYAWYKDGNIIIGNTGASLITAQPGVYSVEIQNQFGCKRKAQTILNLGLVEKPVANFELKENCVRIPIQFSNTSSINNSGNVIYEWNFGNNNTSNASNPIQFFNSTGVYNIVLKVTSTSCPQLQDSVAKQITIIDPLPNVRYLTLNATINKNQQLQARQIGLTYKWNPGVGLNNTNVSNPIFNNGQEQEYLVSIRSLSGCINIDTQLVRVFREGDIFVPNAFTPNRDGSNDTFYPILVGMMRLQYFRVFNRWGLLMHETNDPSPERGWNGIYKGTPQPMDTYTWIAEALDPDGNVVRRSGNCVLIR